MSDGVASELLQLSFDLGDILLKRGDLLIGFEGIELGDALDADLGEASDVFIGDFALKNLQIRFETLPDGGDDGLPCGAFFDVTVDAFFDEYLFQ